LSILFAAGPGRFWARFEQQRERESKASVSFLGHLISLYNHHCTIIVDHFSGPRGAVVRCASLCPDNNFRTTRRLT